jgi:curved DNA-binding protein CbpA
VETDAPDDWYALLGVDPDVDDAGLRRAWKKLARRWHPDRAGADATATFQRLSAAYTVLSDPAARAAYDRRRGHAPKPPPPPAAPKRRAPGVMLPRLSAPLNALLASGIARVAADGVIELLLSAKEAEEGGMATIPMRVPVRGPDGTVSDELFSAWLAVRPGLEDGAILTPSAQLRGVVRPVSFRVRRPG